MTTPRCPVCDVPTVVVGTNGLRCPSCRGLWVAQAQLQRLSDRLPTAFTQVDRDRKLACPACSKRMFVLKAHTLEIDRCSACGGVWLDEGELVRLQEFIAADKARAEEEAGPDGVYRPPVVQHTHPPVPAQDSGWEALGAVAEAGGAIVELLSIFA